MTRWQGCSLYRQGRRKFERGSLLPPVLAVLLIFALLPGSGPALAANGNIDVWPVGPEGDWSRGHWWVGVYAPNLTELDEALQTHGFGSLDGGFGLWGAGTFSEFARMSVAALAGVGAMSSSRGDKYADLSTGFGLIDVALLWPGRGWHVQAGVTFGAGGSKLVLSEGRPDSIDDVLTRRYDSYLSQTFVLIGPSAGFRVDVSKYSSLHFKTGYLYSLAGPWTHPNSENRLGRAYDMSAPFFMVGFTQRFGRGTYGDPWPHEPPRRPKRR